MGENKGFERESGAVKINTKSEFRISKQIQNSNVKIRNVVNLEFQYYDLFRISIFGF